METIINDEAFIQAMKDAVAERGEDFTYPDEWRVTDSGFDNACVYTLEDGTPACIIGLAIYKMLGTPYTGYNAGAYGVLGDLYGGRISIRLRDAAQSAQALQDKGASWGRVLEQFLKAVGAR